MAKKVIYIGLERCDFIFHLAMSLGSIHHVLVCDNSFKGDMYSSIPFDQSENDDNIISWLDIDFARNISASQNVDDYDYILIYAGDRMEEEYISYEDAIFLIMPQCSHQGLQSIKDMCIPLDNVKHVVIMRDQYSKGMTAKTIGTLLNLRPEEIEGFIPHTLEDFGAYLSLTHTGRQNPKCLSSDMREALVYILTVLEDTDRKTSQLMLTRSWGILTKRLKQKKKQEKQESKAARKEKRNGNHN